MSTTSATPHGRKERKAATRQGLKEAAARCFAESGYRGTQVADISREAGVALGTFYVHFPSKEEVLAELLQDFNEALVARLAPHWAEGLPAEPVGFVRGVALTFFDHWRRHRGLVEAFAERAATGTNLAQLRDGVNPPMVSFLEAAIRTLAVSQGAHLPRLDLVVQGILSLWLRIGLQVTFGPSHDEASAADVLARMTVGALRGVLPGIPEPRPLVKKE